MKRRSLWYCQWNTRTADREARQLDRAFGSGFAWPVAFDLFHLGVREYGTVEL
jgi:hypothetical protein